jgi:hypothetical protein
VKSHVDETNISEPGVGVRWDRDGESVGDGSFQLLVAETGITTHKINNSLKSLTHIVKVHLMFILKPNLKYERRMRFYIKRRKRAEVVKLR